MTINGFSVNIIKFCEAKDYATFENKLDNITARYLNSLIPGTATDIVAGLKVANDEMFSEKSGSRSDVPKTLIVVTDGDCPFCTPKGSRFKPSYPGIFEDLLKSIKQRNIRVILVAPSERGYDEIKEEYGLALTNIENFAPIGNYSKLVDRDLLQKISVCDGKSIKM